MAPLQLHRSSTLTTTRTKQINPGRADIQTRMSALFGEVKPQRDEDTATMFNRNVISGAKVMLLAGVLAGSLPISPAGAQGVAPATPPAKASGIFRFSSNRPPGQDARDFRVGLAGWFRTLKSAHTS